MKTYHVIGKLYNFHRSTIIKALSEDDAIARAKRTIGPAFHSIRAVLID